MCASRSARQAPKARTAPSAPVDRAWFLLDSAWHDAIWVLKPTNALEERSPIRVHWNFTLADGGRFTDDRFASLLESSRQLIALIRSRSLSTGLAQRASTAAGNFKLLRELLRWMDQSIVRYHVYDEYCRADIQMEWSDLD